MTEGDKVTLRFIVIIVLIVLIFGTGTWLKFNDWFDKVHSDFYEGSIR